MLYFYIFIVWDCDLILAKVSGLILHLLFMLENGVLIPCIDLINRYIYMVTSLECIDIQHIKDFIKPYM